MEGRKNGRKQGKEGKEARKGRKEEREEGRKQGKEVVGDKREREECLGKIIGRG